MEAARATIDHEIIRSWVEARKGRPAVVRGTRRGESPGILRIDFPRQRERQTLEPIDWTTFFAWFEANELAFLHLESAASSFNKLVSRESATARRTRSTPPRRVHAIDLLERQHRQIEGLFAGFHALEREDEKARAFEGLANVILAHARIEETIFYPELLDETNDDELQAALASHLQLTRILTELLAMPSYDDAFDRKLIELETVAEHHVVYEEEQELFLRFAHVPVDVFEDMGERMRMRFEELLGDPTE